MRVRTGVALAIILLALTPFLRGCHASSGFQTACSIAKGTGGPRPFWCIG